MALSTTLNDTTTILRWITTILRLRLRSGRDRLSFNVNGRLLWVPGAWCERAGRLDYEAGARGFTTLGAFGGWLAVAATWAASEVGFHFVQSAERVGYLVHVERGLGVRHHPVEQFYLTARAF
jgi:hypothetical protein